MIAISKIKMDFVRPGQDCRISAVQGDANTRAVEAALYANGVAWKIPDEVTVQVRYRKPDNTGGVYDTMPDGTRAWTAAGNMVTVLLAPQMLTMNGRVKMQIELLLGADSLATFTVELYVEENPAIHAVKSKDYVNMRGWLVQQLDAALEKTVSSGAFVPTLHIGTVTTLEPGRNAVASFTGSGTSAVLNLGIPAGSTPVKGVDYWTDTDREALQTTVLENLCAELSGKMQLSPDFANSISECTDTGKLYVLPDGYLYAYRKNMVPGGPAYTNLAKASGDEWAAESRISSSGEVVSVSDETGGDLACVTNYIPVRPGDTVRIVGLDVRYVAQQMANSGVYDSGKNYLAGVQMKTLIANGFGTWDSPMTIIPAATNASNAVISPNAVYQRFSGNLIDGYSPEDVVITVNEEIAEKEAVTTFAWVNTGHAFVPADYEDRIVSLEDGIGEQEEAIGSLKKRMAELEEADASVFPAAWNRAVEDVIVKIRQLQREGGRNCTTFAFFSDNHQRLGYAGGLIARVMEECAIPFSFFCGDSVTSGYIESAEAMEAQVEAFDAMMTPIPAEKDCRAVGNHDGYWLNERSEKYHYDWEQIYDLFFRKQAAAQNRVFGGDGSYYYVEDRAGRIRFVVLNSVWMAYAANSDGTMNNSDNWGFGQEQLDWLANVALNFREDGWAVVFLAHAPVTNNYHSLMRDAPLVQGILTAFAQGGTYSGTYTGALNGDNRVSVSVDFSNRIGADLIGWFSGHIHRDRMYTVDDTTDSGNPVALPFTTVTITSDANASYDEEEEIRNLAGDTGHAIDFVTVNRADRTVHLTRLGVGSDRSFTYETRY